MKLRTILPILAVALGFHVASAQIQYTPSKPEASMRDVASGLLNDPKVLGAIGVTEEQMMRMNLRTAIGPIRSMRKMRSAEENGSDEAEALKLNWNVSTLQVDDLSQSQRQRAYEIALQKRVLWCLRTEEISLALHLSATQHKQLLAISANVDARTQKTSNASPEMKAFNKMAEKMQKLGNGDDGISDQDFEAAVATISVEIPRLFFALSARTARIIAEGNVKALKVLTGSQRSQLRKMQGCKF